jgi:CBS domain-containing protein
MKVADCMTRDVRIVSPQQPIVEAARMMLDEDTGALPVGTPDEVSGMITDRDIAVRAVAMNRGPDTPVSEAMSADPIFAYEDMEVDEAAIIMSDRQVRRLPVLSRDRKLVGIISLADLSRSEDTSTAEAAITGVSEPGGEHNQSAVH